MRKLRDAYLTLAARRPQLTIWMRKKESFMVDGDGEMRSEW